MTNDTNTPIAPVYRYYVEDLLSGKKLAELDFRGVSYKLALNAAGEFSGSLVVRETNAVDLYSATLPGVTALYILRNDECVWGGIIWEREYVPEDKKLTVSASEFTSYLHHRKIWKTWNHEYGGTISWRNRWEEPVATEVANWSKNPQPQASGSTDEWTTRFGWTRTHFDTGGPVSGAPYFRWTSPSSQTSANRGWDVFGDLDLAVPGETDAWRSFPVDSGAIVSFNTWIRSSKAVGVSVMARYHDGYGSWLGDAFDISGSISAPVNTWTSVFGSFTPPDDAYVVFSVRTNTGVTYAIGDTIDGSRMFIGVGIYAPNYYIDGSAETTGNVRMSWEGAAHDSYSIREQATVGDGFVGTFEYGSNVLVKPGSTVKLEFYEVENFKYNGYYRVEVTPAPTKDKFYIQGGFSVADISTVEYTGSTAIVYTKEDHGFNDGDVISIAYSMIGDTEYPGSLSFTDVKISAPGGPNSNMFSYSDSSPAGRVLAEGVAMRPLPAGTYTNVTIGVRQDTYDYVRSLVQGTFSDFVGTDFPNEYITPGISRSVDVWSKKSFGGYSILRTGEPHNIAVGQAVQIQNVGPEFDGEFEVTGVEDGYSIVYANGGDYPLTSVYYNNISINHVSQAKGMATLQTIWPHNLIPGQTISLDMGVRYPDITGTFKIHDIPSSTTFRVFTGSTTDYMGTTLLSSTATVAGDVRSVESTQLKNNMATIKIQGGFHGFSIGDSVTVANSDRFTRVIERSLDGPNQVAAIQTDSPHGLQVGSSVELSGLTDGYNIVRATNTTSAVTLTTSAPHNLRVGNSVTISGVDEFRVTHRGIQNNTVTLTTSVPHNVSIGSGIHVTGVVDNYSIKSYRLVNGDAIYTTSVPHNILVNDEITVGGLSDTYTVVTKAAKDGVVTLTTSLPHNIQEGQKIKVSGLGLPFDGEVTVTGFTDQRITYKVDSKYIDAQVAAAAKKGQKLNVPMTVAEQKTTGTITAPESYMNGVWKVSAVTPTTVSVLRSGNNYPTKAASGSMSVLSIVNGMYTVSDVSSNALSYSRTARNAPVSAVPQPIEDDDIPPIVSLPTIFSGEKTVTSVTPTTFTFSQSMTAAASRDASLQAMRPSIFNGVRTVTTVPAPDRFTFTLPGYSYSMIELEQGLGSLAHAGGIFSGTHTIVDVDPVNNTFSYAKVYQDLDEQEVQSLGEGAVAPVAIVSTFGPYPGNADIQFVFPDNEYSGVNIKPALYRGFELKTVGEALDEYASNINGFEYRIDCDYLPDEDRFVKKFVLLPIDFPNPPAEGEVSPISRFGADKLVFEYPAGSVTTFSIRESAEQAATRFFALGESTLGPDVGPYIGVAAADELLRGERDGRRWPLLDAFDTVDGIDDKTVLHAYAKRFLSELQPPFASFQISLNGSRSPYVGTYKPGDWCSIVVNDPWMQMRLASDLEPRNDVLVRKIDSISVSVPDGVTYPENVTVNLVAEWEVDKRG